MTGDAREVAIQLERLAVRLSDELLEAERENARDLIETAVYWTGGEASPADLRAADHPFARRHGTPLWDPARINRQSGDLQEGWELDGPRLEGDALVTGLVNHDPKAELLLAGTPRMFARPFPEAIEAEVTPRVERRRRRAIEEAMR